MKVLLIEDEEQSAKKLEGYLKSLDSSITILSVLSSVRESVEYLESKSEPDLIFLDVQLADGDSFKIFDKVRCEAFIIFVTAYDQHSLQAFDLNTVSYLLKPFDQEGVSRTLEKYYRMRDRLKAESFQSRFVVKKGSNFFTLSSSDIAYFVKQNVLYLVTRSGDKFLYDSSLGALEKQLDSEYFFRINRGCIVNYKCIKSFKPYKSHRYLLDLNLMSQDNLIVSQSRAALFKKWIKK